MLYYIIYIYIVLDRQWSQPLLSILGWLFCLGETCHCRTQEKKESDSNREGWRKGKKTSKCGTKDIGSTLVFLCKLKGCDSDLELMFLKSSTLFS